MMPVAKTPSESARGFRKRIDTCYLRARAKKEKFEDILPSSDFVFKLRFNKLILHVRHLTNDYYEGKRSTVWVSWRPPFSLENCSV